MQRPIMPLSPSVNFLSPEYPGNELDQGMALALWYLWDSQLKLIGFLKVWVVDSSGY